MIQAGAAALADVEATLEDEAVRLERVARASGWRGSAAEQARRSWAAQAGHLRRAAASLREAQQALQDYCSVAEDARQRLVVARAALSTTPPLAQLLDPSGARARAQAADREQRRAEADLDAAARRLAAQLAALEAEARLPADTRAPCAPPPPAPATSGWARVGEVVFGSAEPVLWDVLRCRPIRLVEAGGASGLLRGLARRSAALKAEERRIADAAEGVLRNRDNDHAFKHVDQLFGRKDISAAQRLEWARLIGAALQSSKTFTYRTSQLTGIGRLHQQYGRYWVVVQHPTAGYVRTAFMPTSRQLAAILRQIGS